MEEAQQGSGGRAFGSLILDMMEVQDRSLDFETERPMREKDTSLCGLILRE